MSYSRPKLQTGEQSRPRAAQLTSLSGAAYSLCAAIATALVVIAALTTQGFTTVANLKAIMFSGSFIGIAAIAATVIMLSGSFLSLSLGTTISIAAMAFLASLHLGLVVAILLTLLLGAAIFGVQGLLVGVAEVNPIIVSIGAGSVQIAVATWLTGGENVGPSGASTSYSTLGGQLLGLPFNFYVLVG